MNNQNLHKLRGLFLACTFILSCTPPPFSENSPRPQATPQDTTPAALQDILMGEASPYYQGDAEVGLAANGHFVVSWLQRQPQNQIQYVYQRFDDKAQPLSKVQSIGPALPLSAEALDFADSIQAYHNSPKLAVAPDGHFALLWVEAGQLKLSAYNAQDEVTFTQTLENKLSGDSEADLAVSPAGHWIAVWRSEFGPVRLQSFDKTGQSRGEVHSPFGLQKGTRVAVRPTGGFVVFGQGQYQAYNAEGQPEGELQKNLVGSELLLSPTGQDWLAHLPPGEEQVQLQHFNSAHLALNESLVVNQHPPGFTSPIHARFAQDAAGNIAVVWGEEDLAYTSGDIWLRRMDKSGTLLENEVRVNHSWTGYHSRPAISVNAKGQGVVVWQNWNDNQDRYQMLAQTFNLQESLRSAPKVLGREGVDCSVAALQQSRNILPEFQKYMATLTQPNFKGELSIKRKEGAPSDFGNFTVNGEPFLRYQLSSLIMHPRKSGCMQDYLKLYNGTIKSQLRGFALIAIDLKTAPLDQLEPLMRAFLKENVKSPATVEFSSLEAQQSMAIYLDSLVNQGHYIKSLELNLSHGAISKH